MINRNKVFDAFRNCITEPKCRDCPWEQCEQFNQKKVEIPVTLALDVIELLKEQDSVEYALDVLRRNGWKDDSYGDLLKEQEAVKRTYRTGINNFSIIWTCGACGSDLHPNNAKAKYCSNCGQAVKWE